MEGVVIHQSDVMGTLGKLKRTFFLFFFFCSLPPPFPSTSQYHFIAARFHCVSCSRNLTMETRIRCVECVPMVRKKKKRREKKRNIH